jgi:hypothetical protein
MSQLTSARRPAAPLRLAAQGAGSRRRRWRSRDGARLYCATNGCPTTLRLDPDESTATCPICGYQRRID